MEDLSGLVKSPIEIYGMQIITEKTFVNMLADYRGFDQNLAAMKILKHQQLDWLQTNGVTVI